MKLLMRLYFFFLLILALGCCKDEVGEVEECVNQTADCLIDIEEPVFGTNCELESGPNDVYLGESFLTDSAKESFVDYCYELNSKVCFENENGEKIECLISEKSYVSRIGGRQIGDTDYCRDIEDARIILSSDKFTLRLQLANDLADGFHLVENTDSLAVIKFLVWGVRPYGSPGGTASRNHLDVVLPEYNHLDYYQNLTELTFHSEIDLNGKTYSDIYTNENKEVTGYVRSEIIYFHLTNGLAGVQDSLGVLWTKL